MTFLDHAFVLLAALVYPIVSYFSYRKLLKRIDAGERVERKALYHSTMIGLWALFAMAVTVWAVSGRDWASLGVSFRVDGMFLASIGLLVAGLVYLVMQRREVDAMDDDRLAELVEDVGDVGFVMPRNASELHRFYFVSLTAGVAEELVWRGFFIWYLSQFMPVWAAAIVTTVGFALAHAYQGWANVPKILLIGAVFAVLFLMSGSLWLPMIFHAIVDISQGRLAYDVINRTNINGPPAEDATATASA